MYQYDLFTTTLIVLTHVSEIVKANSTTKRDDLVFWERGSETTTPPNPHFQLKEPSSGYSYQSRKRKLRLMNARNKLQKFFQGLRETGRVVHSPDFEYDDKGSASNSESQMSYSTKGSVLKDKFNHKKHIKWHNISARSPSPLNDVRSDNEIRTNSQEKQLYLYQFRRAPYVTFNIKSANQTSKSMARRQEENSKQEAEKTTANPVGTTKRKKKKHTSDSEENVRLFPFSILNQLKADIIPKFKDVNITVEVLGRTVEYNDIVLLKATQATGAKTFRSEKTKYSEDAPEKKIIFIVHGLSVSGFTVLPCLSEIEYFITLVSYYFKHLDKFDIFLIPMGNPDGVAMARAKPHWNKNVAPQKACPGVAVDRNFDVAWNESHDESTCSQQYPGIMPFSEIESAAVRDTFHKYSHRILGYMHVHVGTYDRGSFKGDAVLYPKGFTEMQSDDDKYIDLKGEIEETMKNASFKVISVTVDTLFNWYGKVTGSSVDYASTIYGVPYAMELVMQLYDDDRMVSDSDERETNAALTEIWQRVLDAIFETMYRSYKKGFDDA